MNTAKQTLNCTTRRRRQKSFELGMDFAPAIPNTSFASLHFFVSPGPSTSSTDHSRSAYIPAGRPVLTMADYHKHETGTASALTSLRGSCRRHPCSCSKGLSRKGRMQPARALSSWEWYFEWDRPAGIGQFQPQIPLSGAGCARLYSRAEVGNSIWGNSALLSSAMW